MPISPGQAIGDYEIIDLLESSKTGVTYKVRNAIVQRFEALRVLPKAVQDDQDAVTRFLREAKVHARINHPNVVSFYHATQLDGQLVMTTELVEGTTLAQRLELGPMPLAETLGCFSQVLSGLAHAHALGVVHRDISSSNIVLTTEGKVKLSGFTLAKAISDPQLTRPGTVIGSLDYMSPEQVKGMTDVDARTDIYSLGAVLFEAVTGRKPFEQKSQFEIMVAHVNTIPPAPSLINPDLPAEISEVVLKALAKDPAARFQTAEEFRARVDHLRGVSNPATDPVPAAPLAAPEPGADLIELAAAVNLADEPASRWTSWNLLAAGLCTFLVVMIVMLIFVARRHS